MHPAAPAPLPVLFVHRGGNQLRGSEEALLTLLDRLDRRQFRPAVICSDAVLTAPVQSLGIECTVADLPEILLLPGERHLPFMRFIRALFALIRAARRLNVKIVFCNGGGPCQVAVPLAKLLRLRCICFLHHPAPRSLHLFWLTRFVDVMIFPSEFTASHTRQKTGRSGHVVHIGIDAEKFKRQNERDHDLRQRHGIDPDIVVFAQIGALVPTKGHDLLLDAFHRIRKQLPRTHLFIIGSGPERDRIRSRVCALDLADCVTLTGYVEDTLPYLRHVIDVNVLASFEEGLGLVNLHASACGLPNIGSDGTGVRETILHGRTGFLFKQGDAGELAVYMARLAADPTLRAELGAEGRAFVGREFTPEKYGAQIQEIMRDTKVWAAAS